MFSFKSFHKEYVNWSNLRTRAIFDSCLQICFWLVLLVYLGNYVIFLQFFFKFAKWKTDISQLNFDANEWDIDTIVFYTEQMCMLSLQCFVLNRYGCFRQPIVRTSLSPSLTEKERERGVIDLLKYGNKFRDEMFFF